MIATALLALALVGLGTWALVGHGSRSFGGAPYGARGPYGPRGPAYPVGGAFTPVAGQLTAPWLSPSQQTVAIRALQTRLALAGYSIAVDGRLGPVTRSAAGDFLQASNAGPFEPWLATALTGTVFTGRHDPGTVFKHGPGTWNDRFGLDRATRMVERPLTGPGGQLDQYGNLRPMAR